MTRSLTLAVSRADSRSDAGAEAVGVGSSALFGAMYRNRHWVKRF